jgi:hypothetical protein
LWLNFWNQENQKNKYPIRLNPEFKISYVERKEDSIKDSK